MPIPAQAWSCPRHLGRSASAAGTPTVPAGRHRAHACARRADPTARRPARLLAEAPGQSSWTNRRPTTTGASAEPRGGVGRYLIQPAKRRLDLAVVSSPVRLADVLFEDFAVGTAWKGLDEYRPLR